MPGFVIASVVRFTAAMGPLLFSGSICADPVWLGSGVGEAGDPVQRYGAARYQESGEREPAVQLHIEFFPQLQCVPRARLRLTEAAGKSARSLRLRVDAGQVWQHPLERAVQGGAVTLDWRMPPALLRAIRQGTELSIQVLYTDAPSVYRSVSLRGAGPAIGRALTVCRHAAGRSSTSE